MLDSDLALISDPTFRALVEQYASDESLFFEDFAAAFSKLSELGYFFLTPVDVTPPMPLAVNASLTSMATVQQGVELAWSFGDDGNVSVSLTLSTLVGWLALGVSHTGRMVHPSPSLAVVGSAEGVLPYRLTAQDAANASRSATHDPLAALGETRFSQADGKTSVGFSVPLSWFDRYLDEARGIWFIFAHGEPGQLSQRLGYHAMRRGSSRVVGFAPTGGGPMPPLSQPPSTQPLATGSVSPQEGLTLSWEHKQHATT